MARKGLVLSGGAGTRLYPLTRGISKQLLPVYDKPMIYYPLSVMMLAGIRDLCIITTPRDEERFADVLGDGSQWGLSLTYRVQARPAGIAQALTLGRAFIDGHPVALILGDNVFYGHRLTHLLRRAQDRTTGATIFGYHVRDPRRYGVVEVDDDRRALSIEEKPAAPRSNYAVTGLYFYDAQAADIAAHLTPSERGELEITDVNRHYLAAGALHVELMGRGMAWLDMGTHESLLQASTFIQTVEERQGLKIACLEEIAYRAGWIDAEQVLRQAHALSGNQYGAYLKSLINAPSPPSPPQSPRS
jgi:glucose-1-phosphate thymidylyltransferase